MDISDKSGELACRTSRNQRPSLISDHFFKTQRRTFVASLVAGSKRLENLKKCLQNIPEG